MEASGDDQNVTFQGSDSTFNAVTVNADDGIFINNVLLATDTGAMTLNSNMDAAADTDDQINFIGAGAGISTVADLTISTIDVSNSLTLYSNGSITITDDLNVPGDFNAVADYDKNGTGDFITNANVDIDTSGANGDINIAADDVILNGTSLNAGGGSITLVPQTTTNLGLGNGVVADFHISDTELDLMTAAGLTIGNVAASFNNSSAEFSDCEMNDVTVGALLAGPLGIEIAGIMTINAGQTLSTTNQAIVLTVDDIDLQGTVNSGVADVSIETADINDSLILGGTGGDLDIDDTEISRITSGGLNLTVKAGGTITVQSVADAAAENAGDIVLDATAAGGSILFNGGSSQFDSLTATADDRITIAVDLTVDTANLSLDADADSAVDGSDNIDFTAGGITLTSTLGSVSMAASSGNIATAGALTINAANGITISDAVTASGAGALTINADSDNNGSGALATSEAITLVDSLVSITAADVTIGANIASGTGGISLLPSDSGGMALTLGGAGGYALDNTELDRLVTTGTLTVGNSNTTSIVTGGNPDNVTGPIILASTAAGSTITIGAALTSSDSLTMSANNGITINDDVTSNGVITIDSDLDNAGAGTLTIANTKTLDSTDNSIGITAADINMNASGAIDAGAGDLTVNQSQAAGTIGLGAAGGTTLSLSDTEIDNITAANMTLNAPSNVICDNLSAGIGNNVNGTFKVDATGSVTFQTADSTFKTLVVEADDGIIVNNVTVTTDTGSLTMDGNVDDSADGTDKIAFQNTASLVSAGSMTLSATNDGITTTGATTLTANDGISLNDNLTAGGQTTIDADNDAGDDNGTFTLANTMTINTANNALNITADDMAINGSINSGNGLITLSVSDGGTIGLGATGGDLTIDNNELSRITTTATGGLTLGGSDSTLTVDGITQAQSDNINGVLTLDATNDNASVIFSNTASTFDQLTVNADNGITIDTDITTDSGSMVLEGDSDNAADAGDDIDIAGNITLTVSGGNLILDATTGKIDAATSLQLDSDGNIVINDHLTTGTTLTIDADNGIQLNGNVSSGGQVDLDADDDDNATGVLTIAGALDTSDNPLNIVADDLTLTGTIDTTSKDISIEPSTGIELRLGTVAGTMQITDAEIDKITTTGDVYLGKQVATSINIDDFSPANVSGTLFLDTTGSLTITGGNFDVTTNNNTIDITADDVVFTGTVDAGSGSVIIRTDDSGSIDLGTAGAGGMTLLNTDLANMTTSGGLTLQARAGETLVVDGVTAPATANISGVTTLNASAAGAGISFANTNSVFNAGLTATAADTISFDAGRQVTAGGNLTLNATNDIDAAGSVSLYATGDLTINNSLTSGGDIDLRADSEGNGTGDFVLAATETIDSTGNNLSIRADDIALNGSIDVGAGDILLLPSSASAIGLGDTASGEFDISDSEFDRMTTSGTLTLGGATAGSIVVDNLTATVGKVTGPVVIVSGQNNGVITFQNNPSSVLDTLTLQAVDGVSVNDGILSGNDMVIDADTDAGDDLGSLFVGTGSVIDTNDNNLDITANDLTLQGGALSLDVGTGDLTIIDSDDDGIGLGGTTVANGLNIDDTEFGRILCANLELITGGAIKVDGISAAGSQNITSILTLDTADSIEFLNNGSIFNALTLEADNAIAINDDITTDTATLVVHADTNTNANAADYTIQIANGIQLDSATTIELNAENGKSQGTGQLTIQADEGITIQDTLETGGDLTIDADNDIDGTGSLVVAGGATLDAGGNNIDITANLINFAGALANITDLVLRATINGDLTVSGSFGNSGSVELESINGTVTVNNALSSNGAITITAKSGVILNDTVTADADTNNPGGDPITINADSNSDGTGDLTLATTKQIITNDNNLTVTANDLDLAGTASINVGNGQIRLIDSDGSGMALGDTVNAGEFHVAASELQRITASQLELETTGASNVDNISGANSNNIGLVLLDSAGLVSFINNASTFNALTVQSDDGIAVNQNLTTDTGSLTLDGDADGGADTRDDIAFAAGVVLTSQNEITLDASAGDMTAAGDLDLLSEGSVTINDSLTALGNITVNTDAVLVDNDGTGDLVIAAAATLSTATNDTSLDLTANDLDLNGIINCGVSDFTITVSDGMNYGLGDSVVAGGFNIDGTELANIYTGNLILNTSGSAALDNISALSSNNITYMVTFNVAGHATLTSDCIFNALTIYADDGITLAGNVVTQAGDIILDGDKNNAADTNDKISFASGSTLQSARVMVLDSTTGKMEGSGSLTLQANGAMILGLEKGITINDNLTTNGHLTMNADLDDDGIGRIISAPGASYDCSGYDLSVTASSVDFNSPIAGVDGLFLAATTGDMTITGNFVNTGDLGLTVTKGYGIINNSITSGGAISISTKTGLEVNDDLIANGLITINSDNSSAGLGDLVVAPGVQISSNNADVYITTNDINDLSGMINSGTGVVQIDSNASGIGLGSASVGGGLNLSNAELAEITTSSLRFVTDGDIVIAGVSAGSNQNIDLLILDTTGQVRFNGGESVFNALDVRAGNGINIETDLTTDEGELAFNNDPDRLSGSGNGIQFGEVTITSGNVLALGGDGDLTGTNNLVLISNGDMTIKSDFNVNGTLDIQTRNNQLVIESGAIMATHGQDIQIDTGDMVLDGALSSGSGNILINPTTRDTVGLGTGTGSLSLSTDELDSISAHQFEIETDGAIILKDIPEAMTDGIMTLKLETSDSIHFDDVVINSNLIASAGGGIGQGNAIKVTGNSDLITDQDDQGIVLTNNSNALQGTISLQTVSSGNNLAVVQINNGTVDIELAASTVAGDLSLTTEGQVSQTGDLSVAGNLEAVTAGIGDIIMDQNANNIDGTVSFQTADGNVTFNNGLSPIVLNDVNIAGDMAVETKASITDSGSVNVTGLAAFSTYSDNDGSIILDNQLSTFGSIRVSTMNANSSASAVSEVSIYEGDSMEVAGIETAGDVTLTAEGNITQTGSINVDGSVAFKTLDDNGGDIILDGDNEMGRILALVRDGLDDNDAEGDITIHENHEIEIGQLSTMGAITLKSNDIRIEGPVSGFGRLWFEPMNPDITFAIGEASGGLWKLDNNEISQLQDGFSEIVIGTSTMTGSVNIDEVVFTDPIHIQTKDIIDVKQTLGGTDNASITLTAPEIVIKDNLNTQGSNITLNGAIDVLHPVIFSTGGQTGVISLNGNADCDDSIQMLANTISLHSVQSEGPQNYSAEQINISGDYDILSDDDLGFNGSVILNGNSHMTLQKGDITVSEEIDGPYDLDIDTDGGSILFGSDIGLSSSLANLYVDTHYPGTIRFNSTILVDGDIHLNVLTDHQQSFISANIFKQSEGDLIFQAGGEFVMAPNSALVVMDGSLIINTGTGAISVGDLTAKGDILLTAQDGEGVINILTREKRETLIVKKDAFKEITDQGLSVVAGGKIELNGQSILLGEGLKPYLVTGNKKDSLGFKGFKVYTIKELPELFLPGDDIVVYYVPVSDPAEADMDEIAGTGMYWYDQVYWHDRLKEVILSDNSPANPINLVDIKVIVDRWFLDDEIGHGF